MFLLRARHSVILRPAPLAPLTRLSGRRIPNPHFQARFLSNTTTLREDQAKTRTAIVTGASRGIGRAIAVRLAQDGYAVTVNDLPSLQPDLESLAGELQSAYGAERAYAHTADVSFPEQVAGLVQASIARLGPLDTFVANAGIAQVKPLLELTPEDWKRMFEVNVAGVHYCFQEAAKAMIAHGTENGIGKGKGKVRGKLISAASIVAFKPFARLGHYSASKWAVRGLTQVYAMELARYGITVNAYAPGIVDTKMWELIDDGLGRMEGKPKGEMIRRYSDQLIALGRTSVPEDVAGLVSFLASKDADYITGQTYIVDGGIIYT
jgi:acetoin reductase-like protein